MKRTPLLLAGLLLAGPAGAQNNRHDSNAPVDVAADRAEVQDKAARAVLTGNVVVRQAEMTVNADRMTLAYTGRIVDGSQQISRIDAAGSVVVTRPDQVARSQFAIYDLNRRVVTMVGNVRLVQNGNTSNGGRLTLNLDTNRAVLDGSSVAGGGGVSSSSGVGRVTGRFSVPKRDDASTPAQAPLPTPQ
ncbi:MAG: OstA family protein [Sphingomonas sp.]|jgi:lipopolysaccharide export system protein LptA|uniref:LptA/OstA family protein n=1 Tax=Sphingomonas sp. TaxID=28214 RepID=UPI0025F893E4|nr:LptA/OstA family protein [Sphingomonas sp.]MBX9880931.1 OstA family protein [Sphingomonas sp.]